jgi:CRP-like cAMP-binding protein
MKEAQLIDTQYDDQINIADHIINGSIEIRSIEAFKEILKRFPNNWALLKMYAEMLQKKGLPEDAVKTYANASKNSLEANKVLEAITFKILQWRIAKPEKLEAQKELAEIKKNIGEDTPLHIIFGNLSFQEIIAIFSQIEIENYTAGKVIKKIGDIEDNLYFVVSGTLKDSFFLTIENDEKIYRKPTIYRTENDFFGDIYPFDRENKCKSYIESMEQVVLIRITKKKLFAICQKYQKIELALMNLFNIRSKIDVGDPQAKLRRSQRFQLMLSLNLIVYPKASSNKTINLNGFTSDISISGMCYILDDESYKLSLNNPTFSQTLQNAQVQINLSVESLSLTVKGRVAWKREVSFEGRKTLSLGISFETLSPKIKGMLISLFNGLKNM